MKLRNKKTGEIDEFIFEVITDRIDLYRCVGTSDTKNVWKYSSLAELNEEWEDYKPKEPLVEGRSQRAVLRAAARLTNTNVATVRRSDIAGIVIFDFGGQCRVELKDSGINVMNSGAYTIAELCGEEEECER